ncbi:MAG: Enoyl-CoA hydratase/isomerase [Actinomycetia bacterium]|nr:Enoyl-CoA hydratase/isomerase [Actinomycetes bacterium]
MTYETLLFDISEQVATITLHRPDRRNAWTKTMELELSAAMARCDADDDVRAVIVTGSGAAFSVGADLDDPTIPANSGKADDPVITTPLVLPSQLRKPVIAAIQGDAIGAGSTYPMSCDIRIVAETARLGFVFVKRGLMPGYGSMWALPRVIGLSRALELVLTGRIFSGVEAVELGMCHRAVPAGDVLAEARAIATGIARDAGPGSAALVKRLLWMSGGMDMATYQPYERDAVAWSAASSESTEGIQSFLEKRPPVWQVKPSTDLPAWFDDPAGL